MNWRILFLVLAALWAAGPRLSPAAGPNVVLVLVDDAGYGDLACLGNPVLKTPHLDQLHSESIRLTDFHVGPMCTPTRGQLLTGVDALRNGAMNVSSGRTLLRSNIPTLADLFAAAGYRTGQFGKWHLGDNYPYRPQDRGFQQSLWFPSSHIPSAPDYFHNSYFDPWLRHETGDVRQSKGYCTDVYFDAAMHFIRDRKTAGEPFFVYLPLNAAHSPLLVPEKYVLPYADQPTPVVALLRHDCQHRRKRGPLERAARRTRIAREHHRHLHDRQRWHHRCRRLQCRHAGKKDGALRRGPSRSLLHSLARRRAGQRAAIFAS